MTALLAAALLLPFQSPRMIAPAFATDTLTDDPDDPAVWVHPERPEDSRIIGTNKIKAPGGALYVFDLNGHIIQRIPNLDRPNNVDVQTGFRAGGRRVDIAVAAERNQERLKVYFIDPRNGWLNDRTGNTHVFAGRSDDESAVMGIALYRRPADGKVFAIVSRKSGPSGSFLGQYELRYDAQANAVDAVPVREFGLFSGKNEIEALMVDDELGYVYASDEGFGVRKYHADPSRKDANRELATFATSGWAGDHEGIALYRTGRGTGWIAVTDQIPGGSVMRFFPRQGEPGRPHLHQAKWAVNGGADSTDGIEICDQPLGPRFPNGLLVAMNSEPRNFLVFDWRSVFRR